MGRKCSMGASKCSLSGVRASNSVCNRWDTILAFACRELRKPRNIWAKVIRFTIGSRTRYTPEQYGWANLQAISSLQLPELFPFTISAWHRLQSSIYVMTSPNKEHESRGLCLKLLCVAPTGNGACYTHDNQERWRDRAVSIGSCTGGLIV